MAKYRDKVTGEVIDVSAPEAFMWGVDKTMRNVVNAVPGVDFPPNPSQPPMGALEELHPLATGAGKMAPGFIGPMRAGMLANTAFGALSGALTADPGQRAEGAAWGMGGALGGDMAGRVVGRIKNLFGAGGGRAVAGPPADLEQAGYKLTPAQRTGNQAQLKVERSMEKNPWNAQRFNELGEFNEELLNSRMNEAIGLPADNGPLNRNARTLAAENIGQNMEDIAQGIDMDIPESLANRVSRIVKNDDMLEIPELPAGGTISGEDYMRIRSDLSRAQRASQGSARDYIGNTLDAMDELFLDVAGPEQAAAYRVAREQYKNLSLFERGSSLTPDGQINLRSAGNAFRSKQGYGKRGIENALPQTKQLINDLDNLSSKAVNPYIGNSGTPEGLMGFWQPGSWPGGILGKGYLDGQWGLGGLRNPASQTSIGLGANIGRGLLSNQE